MLILNLMNTTQAVHQVLENLTSHVWHELGQTHLYYKDQLYLGIVIFFNDFFVPSKSNRTQLNIFHIWSNIELKTIFGVQFLNSFEVTTGIKQVLTNTHTN